MLVLDCDGRISASEALSHTYFSQYHDPDDEPEAPPYDQTLESKDRTLEEWKGRAVANVMKWKISEAATQGKNSLSSTFEQKGAPIPVNYFELKRVKINL